MAIRFAFPTQIVFGAGSTGEVAAKLTELRSKRPLIVTDAGLVKTATFARAALALPKDVAVFADVQSNPSAANVEAAVAAFTKNGCDSVIGLGGGGAIDVGKVIRLRIKLPAWKLTEPPPTDDVGPLAPFIAIPTTAGTGSEVGRSSVITLDNQKLVIFHPALLANL